MGESHLPAVPGGHDQNCAPGIGVCQHIPDHVCQFFAAPAHIDDASAMVHGIEDGCGEVVFLQEGFARLHRDSGPKGHQTAVWGYPRDALGVVCLSPDHACYTGAVPRLI